MLKMTFAKLKAVYLNHQRHWDACCQLENEAHLCCTSGSCRSPHLPLHQ